jgi:phage tail-like protein
MVALLKPPNKSSNPRKDPVGVYHFIVEIDKLTVGGFSEVSGLEAEIETYEYAEGGCNDYKHIFPKGQKYPKLVLKRGIIDLSMYKWYSDCVACTTGLKSLRRNGAVHLLDQEGKNFMTWTFTGAYPVKCSGPQLKAGGNDIAVESYELVHQGLTMKSP